MINVWLINKNAPLFVWRQEQHWQPMESWQKIRDEFGNQPICLYFPTSHLQQIITDLSAAQLKALGETGQQYLFEDISLTPVEQLLIKTQPITNQYCLSALAKTDLEQWQQSLSLVGLTLSALLPDFLLLPTPEENIGQQITLYQDQYTTIIRQSKQQGIPATFLPLVLQQLPHLNEICQLQNIDPNINPNDNTEQLIKQLPADILLTPIQKIPTPISQPETHLLNFFKKKQATLLTPYLTVTIIVLTCALLTQIIADGLQWYRYHQAAQATKLVTKEQYDYWFPNEPLNLKLQLQRQIQPKLQTNQDNDHTTIILAQLPNVLQQNGITAQSFNLNSNDIRLTVISPNRENLDKMTTSLNAQGIKTTLGNVSRLEGDKILGQINISRLSSESQS